MAWEEEEEVLFPPFPSVSQACHERAGRNRGGSETPLGLGAGQGASPSLCGQEERVAPPAPLRQEGQWP